MRGCAIENDAMIIRVEAIAAGYGTAPDRAALSADERERLHAAVDAALPGRKVHVVVARSALGHSPGYLEPDFAALANLLAQVHRESGDLEAAVRVVVHASHRGHCSTRSAEVNEVVAAVAEWDGVRPQSILAAGRGTHKVSAARAKCWAILRRRGLLLEALAAAFERDQSTVSVAVSKVEARALVDAELRSQLEWADAKARRRVA